MSGKEIVLITLAALASISVLAGLALLAQGSAESLMRAPAVMLVGVAFLVAIRIVQEWR